MSFESEELNDFGSESPSIHEPELHHSNSTEQWMSSGPYIMVVHHPHSGLPDDFIYHDANTPTPSTGEALLHVHRHQMGQPWAPFRTRADFEFAQLNVDAGLSAEFTKRMLKGVTGSWVDPGHGKVTFSSLDDYKAGLEAARNWVPEFKKSSVSEVYDGKEYTFDFYYHDPWQWILSLVTDATLAKHLIQYPVKKYLHDDNIVTQLYDDIDSGESWWNIQVNSVLEFGVEIKLISLL
ncbi:hypothetical protein BU17DRAFT_87479 [Hysterangium stoloniferum]|nr:hypothetical protein BU17DRAFT_87479 [Hysterangium stoloniferum]